MTHEVPSDGEIRARQFRANCIDVDAYELERMLGDVLSDEQKLELGRRLDRKIKEAYKETIESAWGGRHD